MFKIGIGVLGILILVVVVVVSIYNFDNGCGSYLKLAGDAPTVEKADEFLGRALEYIEQNGLTRGNSAYLMKTPASDLKIWYEQIKGAKATTESILARQQAGEQVTQLEKDNALMKIREVVLDDTSSGTSVTQPAWVTVHPNQWIYLAWALISIGLAVWGFIEA